MEETREDRPKHFGEHLRALRLKGDHTLGEVSAAAGISIVYLRQIEQGSRPSLKAARALLRVLDWAQEGTKTLIRWGFIPAPGHLWSIEMVEWPGEKQRLAAGHWMRLADAALWVGWYEDEMRREVKEFPITTIDGVEFVPTDALNSYWEALGGFKSPQTPDGPLEAPEAPVG